MKPGPQSNDNPRRPVNGTGFDPRGTCPGPPVDAAASCAKPDRPNPQSQSLSRSYGSNLPTSLTYIILSTRGCSPWRPAADMGTSWSESAVISLGFSRSHRPLVALARTASVFAKTKTRSLCERIPGPRRLMQKRQLFPELRWASPSRVALPRRNARFRNGSTARFWNKDQIPFRPSCGFTKELRKSPHA